MSAKNTASKATKNVNMNLPDNVYDRLEELKGIIGLNKTALITTWINAEYERRIGLDCTPKLSLECLPDANRAKASKAKS